MKLPRQKKEKQKGQILIIFLLVLVVTTAIVLSLASRSLTDVNQTTTSDESNRAYFAAEAGIESALKKISGSTGTFQFNLDFTNVNKTSSNINSRPTAASSFYDFPGLVGRDQTVQASLLTDFYNLGGSWYTGNNINVYWGNTNPVDSPMPAVEITEVYLDGAGNFQVTKWALDPNAARSAAPPAGNGFCQGLFGSTNHPKTSSLDGTNKDYWFEATINVQNGTSVGCPAPNPAITVAKTVLLRIKPLYNTTSIPIAIEAEIGSTLPSQGFIVDSTGSTDSGVTRKLEVIQPYPALPSIFDYVLFNGSSNTLTK